MGAMKIVFSSIASHSIVSLYRPFEKTICNFWLNNSISGNPTWENKGTRNLCLQEQVYHNILYINKTLEAVFMSKNE